jgi:hypothetical protein
MTEIDPGEVAQLTAEQEKLLGERIGRSIEFH